MSFTGGEDYEIPTNQYFKVLFPAGSTVAKFDVYIMNDNKIENNETFYGTIYDLSVPYGINLGSTASATFTILDDDSKHTYIIMYNIYRSLHSCQLIHS